ncbi:hypothetical protein ACN47E_005036 [Coniothyrium glycines]
MMRSSSMPPNHGRETVAYTTQGFFHVGHVSSTGSNSSEDDYLLGVGDLFKSVKSWPTEFEIPDEVPSEGSPPESGQILAKRPRSSHRKDHEDESSSSLRPEHRASYLSETEIHEFRRQRAKRHKPDETFGQVSDRSAVSSRASTPITTDVNEDEAHTPRPPNHAQHIFSPSHTPPPRSDASSTDGFVKPTTPVTIRGLSGREPVSPQPWSSFRGALKRS